MDLLVIGQQASLELNFNTNNKIFTKQGKNESKHPKSACFFYVKCVVTEWQKSHKKEVINMRVILNGEHAMNCNGVA